VTGAGEQYPGPPCAFSPQASPSREAGMSANLPLSTLFGGNHAGSKWEAVHKEVSWPDNPLQRSLGAALDASAADCYLQGLPFLIPEEWRDRSWPDEEATSRQHTGAAQILPCKTLLPC